MNATEQPARYDCAGLALPNDEYVPCFRAGHRCPPYVRERTEDATHRTVTYRCPCCGQHGMAVSSPLDWDEVPIPASLHAGIVLDGGGSGV